MSETAESRDGPASLDSRDRVHDTPSVPANVNRVWPLTRRFMSLVMWLPRTMWQIFKGNITSVPFPQWFRQLYLRISPSVKSADLWDRTTALLSTYESNNDQNRLVEALHVYEGTLTEEDNMPNDSPHSMICSRLSIALRQRFLRLGSSKDLEQSERMARRALKLSGALDNTARIFAMINLGETLRISTSFNDTENLEEAITLIQEAIDQCPAGHTYRLLSLIYFGKALDSRFTSGSVKADIENSIDTLREAVAIAVTDHQHVPLALRSLATSLRNRSLRTGSLTDLDEAIDLCRRSLAAHAPNDTDRSETLNLLGASLQDHHRHTSNPETISECVVVHRQALGLRPPGHPMRAVSLSNLGIALYLSRNPDSRLQNLNDAILYLREAKNIPSGRRPKHIYTLLNLSVCLRERFLAVTGSTVDLDEGIDVRQEALSICPSTHRMHASALFNLADGLIMRYDAFGHSPDLERAQDLLRQALAEQQLGDPFRSVTVARMSQAYALSVKRSQIAESVEPLEALDGILSILREQNEAEPIGGAVKTQLLSELGIILHLRFLKSGERIDLDESLQYHRQAIELEPVESEQHQFAYPLDYATALIEQFRTTNDSVSATSALKYLESALKRLPYGHLYRSDCLVQLSELHLGPETPFYSPSIALGYLVKGLEDENSSGRARLINALGVLEQIRHLSMEEIQPNLPALSDAYSSAVQLLPQIAYFGMNPQHRLKSLAQAEPTAIDAAACALLLNLSETALELLEQGRSLFWTQTLRLRTSFDEVPEQLRNQVATLARLLELESVSDFDELDVSESRRRSEQLGILLQQIRALPDLERFMLPEQYSVLSQVASGGPVAVLVASSYACFAVLMQEHRKPVALNLKSVSLDWLRSSADLWKEGTLFARHAESGDSHSRLKMDKLRHKKQPGQSQLTLLKDIWDRIVMPIMESLQLQPQDGRKRPRLWWCTTSLFSFLPIHAAGVYPNGPCCSDYVVSSYAPTLNSILSARKDYQPVERAQASAVIAGVPIHAHMDWPPLPFTIDEARAVRAVLPPKSLKNLPPEDDLLSNLPNAGMSAQTLVSEMSGSVSILHLACHGIQNTANPLESGFVMRDQVLTIAKLMPTPLPHSFFAFLSACETAKGDPRQPDQTVHLAATMLFAGFKSVIATMWSMDDCDGPLVAKTVYKALFEGDREFLDENSIPYALDDAVRELRKQGLSPSRWAPYVHMGI